MTVESVELLAKAAFQASGSDPITDVSFLKAPTSENYETEYQLTGISGLSIDQINSLLDSNNQGYSLKLGPREIVILLGLKPEFQTGSTPQSLRDDIYRGLMQSPKGIIICRLNMHHGLPPRRIETKLTKVESNMSVATPQIQISLEAIRSPFLGETWDHLGALTRDGDKFTILDTVSTAAHGFQIAVKINSTITGDFYLQNILDQSYFRLRPSSLIGGSFQADDTILINSFEGRRSVQVARGGGSPTFYNAAAMIMVDSIWPEVTPNSPTRFQMNAEASLNEILGYFDTYWGL